MKLSETHKLLGLCLPHSQLAEKFGHRATGCWYVATIEVLDGMSGENYDSLLLTTTSEKSARDFLQSLPYPLFKNSR